MAFEKCEICGKTIHAFLLTCRMNWAQYFNQARVYFGYDSKPSNYKCVCKRCAKKQAWPRCVKCGEKISGNFDDPFFMHYHDEYPAFYKAVLSGLTLCLYSPLGNVKLCKVDEKKKWLDNLEKSKIWIDKIGPGNRSKFEQALEKLPPGYLCRRCVGESMKDVLKEFCGDQTTTDSVSPNRERRGMIVVDGSNLLRGTSVAGMQAVLETMISKHYGVKLFFDANILYYLGDNNDNDGKVYVEGILENKKYGAVLVPAGSRADDFILQCADRENACVLSNDRYLQYVERYPWIKEGRIHHFLYDDGRISIPELEIDVKVSG